jgi:hypothetical protein
LLNFRHGADDAPCFEITSCEHAVEAKNCTPRKKKEINAILETIDLVEKITRNKTPEVEKSMMSKTQKITNLPSLNLTGRNSILKITKNESAVESPTRSFVQPRGIFTNTTSLKV